MRRVDAPSLSRCRRSRDAAGLDAPGAGSQTDTRLALLAEEPRSLSRRLGVLVPAEARSV
jgi:hypothetical protein